MEGKQCQDKGYLSEVERWEDRQHHLWEGQMERWGDRQQVEGRRGHWWVEDRWGWSWVEGNQQGWLWVEDKG